MELEATIQNRGARFGVSLALAGVVTISLFYLMYYLIANPNAGHKGNDNDVSITFEQVKLNENLETKVREIPKKPPPPKEPPPPPKMNVENTERQQLPMPMNLNLNIGFSGSGPFLGNLGVDRNAEGEVIPLVRIQPMYPREAALNRVEGEVTMEFTITETGSVTDVSVVHSTNRVFNREAVRAILKWKFKPRIEDGKPIPRRAIQTIEFKLED